MINGEKDTIIDVKDNEAFAKKIKKCKRIVVPGAGHFLHLENEQIMNMYEEFFKQ
jgi:pimeloyl-ACP methyl ester carboxylesterase